MRILLVEDDADIAVGLAGALTHTGYAVDSVADGKSALAALDLERYDLVLLDLGLPRMDGFEVLRQARAKRLMMPMLIMTARDALDDRVRGLDLGADDYLVKPFALAELEARMRALIRRSAGTAAPEIRIGGLAIDTNNRAARFGEEPIKLSPRDFAMLEILAVRAGQVVSKDRLITSMSTWDKDFSENSAEVYIHRLRKKLGPLGVQIVTMRGFGYLIRASP
jgi:two-component system, OmpR family, response regulator